MTHAHHEWRPGPELLAAYFDGELTGRHDLNALRRRVQDWLRRHPEARAELGNYRQLDRLWQETAPPEPRPEAWQQLETRLERAALSRRARPRRPLLRRWAAGLLATAAGVALLVWLGLSHEPAPTLVQPKAVRPAPVPIPPDDTEIFPVATAAEIAILHVEGADTQTLAVGELPVQGPLELAGPGEVALTSVQPDARDNMIPNVRIGGSFRPMIWAPFAAEDR